MQSPETISGKKRPTIWSDSATAHVTLSGEGGYLLSALQDAATILQNC
jgi:hypothetical protein